MYIYIYGGMLSSEDVRVATDGGKAKCDIHFEVSF